MEQINNDVDSYDSDDDSQQQQQLTDLRKLEEIQRHGRFVRSRDWRMPSCELGNTRTGAGETSHRQWRS